jgi:hypothetical protein
MAKKKAGSISLDELDTAINKAVEKELEIQLRSGFQVHSGIIYGRLMKDESDLDSALSAAKGITNAVAVSAKKSGVAKLSPAVLTTSKGTTIGFVAQ